MYSFRVRNLGAVQVLMPGRWRTTSTTAAKPAMTAAERKRQIEAQEALRRRGYQTAAEQRAAAEKVAAYQAEALATRRAKEERIRQAEELQKYRIRTTPFEQEAERRMVAYQRESAFNLARRNFESALSKYPPGTRAKVKKVMKAHDAYETLPGYADFTAGRRTMAEIMPAILDEYKRMTAKAEAEFQARRAAFDERHERIYAEIQAEKKAKAAQEAEARAEAIERRSAARKVAEARTRTREAAAQLREDVKAARQAEIRAGMRAESKTEWELKLLAHPKLPGSPPVSAAIAEVSLQMGITPGYIDGATYNRLRSAVYTRARKLSGDYFYYERNVAGKRSYDTSRVAVSNVLKAEGYIVGEAPKRTEARIHVEQPPQFTPTPPPFPQPERLPMMDLPAMQIQPPGLVAQYELPPVLIDERGILPAI